MESAGFFARLPAELRNKIYDLTLVNNSAVVFGTPFVNRRGVYKPKHDKLKHTLELRHNLKPRLVQPALTRTCRAIRQEALSIFYGGNVFLLQGSPFECSGMVWLKHLAKTDRKALVQLYVPVNERRYWVGDLERAFGANEVAFHDVDGAAVGGRLERGRYLKVTFH